MNSKQLQASANKCLVHIYIRDTISGSWLDRATAKQLIREISQNSDMRMFNNMSSNMHATSHEALVRGVTEPDRQQGVCGSPERTWLYYVLYYNTSEIIYLILLNSEQDQYCWTFLRIVCFHDHTIMLSYPKGFTFRVGLSISGHLEKISILTR